MSAPERLFVERMNTGGPVTVWAGTDRPDIHDGHDPIEYIRADLVERGGADGATGDCEVDCVERCRGACGADHLVDPARGANQNTDGSQ